MELLFFGKNIEINNDIKDYVTKKVDRLTRYLPGMVEMKVEITEEKTKSPDDRFTAQITIRSKGNLLRGEERSASINLAIDSVVDVLARQISRYKGKFNRKGKGVLLSDSIAKAEIAGVTNTELPEIVRKKRFLVKSMSVAEAAEQMELTSHDFFLFVSEDSKSLNLLYRRKDGNYGLIEPELEIDQ